MYEIQFILNTKMEAFNVLLFWVKKELPYIQFNVYNSYKFETSDNMGTGLNYKGMVVYNSVTSVGTWHIAVY